MKFPSTIEVIKTNRCLRRSRGVSSVPVLEIANGNILDYLYEEKVTEIAVYKLVSERKLKLKTITEEVK